MKLGSCYWLRSRHDVTCFRNDGAGMAVLRISWLEVAVITEAVGGAPGAIGGESTITGIEPTPRPTALKRGVEAVGAVTAVPVAKSIRA